MRKKKESYTKWQKETKKRGKRRSTRLKQNNKGIKRRDNGMTEVLEERKKLVETNKLQSRRQLGNIKQGEKLVIMKKIWTSVCMCVCVCVCVCVYVISFNITRDYIFSARWLFTCERREEGVALTTRHRSAAASLPPRLSSSRCGALITHTGNPHCLPADR